MKKTFIPRCFLTNEEITEPYCYFEAILSGATAPFPLCFEIGVLMLSKKEEKELLTYIEQHPSLEISEEEYNYLVRPLQEFKKTSDEKHLRPRSFVVFKAVRSIYGKVKERRNVAQGSNSINIAASLR